MSDPPYVDVEYHDDIAVLRAVGEFDLETAHLLREPIIAALNEDRSIVIDLAPLEFLDSTILAALVTGWKAARRQGRWLRLANPSGHVLKLLQITALDGLFGVYGSVEEAVGDA